MSITPTVYWLSLTVNKKCYTGKKHGKLPFTTSTTSQFGSILPMCLGWAGLVLPSKINAKMNTNFKYILFIGMHDIWVLHWLFRYFNDC